MTFRSAGVAIATPAKSSLRRIRRIPQLDFPSFVSREPTRVLWQASWGLHRRCRRRPRREPAPGIGHDSWGARLIIQVASSLGPPPAVVARRRETHDPKCRVQWQNLSCAFARSQKNPLGIAFGKSLVIMLYLRGPNQRDQEADDRSEQSRSTPQPFDLGDELTTIVVGKVTGDDVSRAARNPTSNGRAGDVQFWEEIAVSRFADRLLDSVVVGLSRAASFHLDIVGRCLREVGTAGKCPILSRSCNCNALSPECHETPQLYSSRESA